MLLDGALRTAFLVLYTRRLNGVNPISGTEKVRQSHLLRMTLLRARTAGSAARSRAPAGGTSRAEPPGDGGDKSDPMVPKLLYQTLEKAIAQRWDGD